MKFRIALCMLAVLLLLPLVSSCTTTSNANSTEEASSNAEEATTRPVITQEEEIVPELPDIQFGATVNIFLRKDSYIKEWDLEENESGTVALLDDALFSRNSYLEETYDVTFAYTNVRRDECVAQVRQQVSAGQNVFDYACIGLNELTILSQEGLLQDVSELAYTDYSKPWWYYETMQEFARPNGEIYYALGYSNINMAWNSYLVFFNQDEFAKNFQDVDLFEVVRNGEWTLSKMLEMAKAAYHDVGGDGDVSNDFYGILSQGGGWYGIMAGGGIQLVSKNSDGFYQSNLLDSMVYDHLSQILNFMGDFEICMRDGDQIGLAGTFAQGSGLFFPASACGAVFLSQMEDLFGVVPSPFHDAMKLDNSRPATEQYYTHSHYGHTNALAIFVNTPVESLDMVSILWEAANYASIDTVSTAIVESVLQGRLVQEADSAEMMEIILSNIHLDPIFLLKDSTCDFDTVYRKLIRQIGESGTATGLPILSELEQLNSALNQYLDQNINVVA